MAVRLEDFVGRYGGEEFVILLPEVDRQTARQTAEYVCSAIVSLPYSWQPDNGTPAVSVSLTVSIGMAIYPLHGESSKVLLEAADRAMYQAKYTGCCVCLADGEMTSPRVMPSLQNEEKYTAEVMVVQALTAATAAHDRGTETHAQRMASLAEALARQLKRPEEERHLIRLAARLHDIGKIGIPQAILNKPGSLTEGEWNIVYRHPEIGCQILEQIGGVFGLLTTSVIAHHERWDGGGYPLGLAKETIPLSARILAVVDSYDAMTTSRPYRRDALTLVEARTELQRCAASQYDPQVVEAFLSVLAEQENTQGPPGEAADPGTLATPTPTMCVTMGQVWEQREAWRQQQLTWQQRREAWQQQQQQFAQQKQELEQQHKLLRKQAASRNTNGELTSSRS
jgi:putative nucleotidyltransferase with HDIG domain